MNELTGAFDAESLNALESMLDEIHSELLCGKSTTAVDRPVISREDLAKLILDYARLGESDPAKIRALILQGLGRK